MSEEEKRDIAVDKEIQRILKQQKKKERKEIKILLLGEWLVIPNTVLIQHMKLDNEM